MPSFREPKKNTAYIAYISLASVASTGLFQTNPTLAAGDVKVSIDGGALANITTLPVVTPAASKNVKLSLSAAEMNGDNIAVCFSDVAGAEWQDFTIILQTTSNQLDDLMLATAGATLQTSATDLQARVPAALVAGRIDASVGAMATDTLTAAALATSAVTEMQTGLATPTNITTVATVTNLTNAPTAGDLTATMKASVTAAVPSAATIQTGIATGAALAVVATYIDTEVAAIKAKTDNLPALPAAVADIPSAATIAAAVLAATIEGAYTFVQAQRLMLSVLTGKSSGGGTTAIKFRDTGDTKDRIAATVDASGNRSAVTRDGS